MSTHVADLLGAWALDVCGDDEAATVEAHLGQCDECASEATRLRAAVGWLGVERVIAPPLTLRQSVLDEARRRRAPVAISTLVEAYSVTAALLHDALGRLDPSSWHRRDARHGDVAGVVRHLTANDAVLASELGLPRVPAASNGTGSVHEAWRLQSEILLRGLGTAAGSDLDRVVTLAGRAGGLPGSLHDALVQRAFETWIHLEDVRGAAVPPSPERVRRIVALAIGLLPRALAAQGLSWPGTFRLHLTGLGSGEWSFPLGGPDAEGGPAVTMEAVEFTRLVAGRRAGETVNVAIEGDNRVALQVLRIASTLGCD
ncbi:MAG TPA: zf-HC2 domain-containing protein [Candidatus Limnocylindrales bacterium]|nr:zf-HC2 domain-containing protein [Candidatus Limnocylindrales bacterium]